MKTIENKKIIGIDHGYGNIKTSLTVTSTGITPYKTEPLFQGNILKYENVFYRIGEGHKAFIPDKATDNDFYVYFSAGLSGGNYPARRNGGR